MGIRIFQLPRPTSLLIRSQYIFEGINQLQSTASLLAQNTCHTSCKCQTHVEGANTDKQYEKLMKTQNENKSESKRSKTCETQTGNMPRSEKNLCRTLPKKQEKVSSKKKAKMAKCVLLQTHFTHKWLGSICCGKVANFPHCRNICPRHAADGLEARQNRSYAPFAHSTPAPPIAIWWFIKISTTLLPLLLLLWLLRQSIPIGQGEHNKSAPGASSIAKRVNAAQLLLATASVRALFAAKLMSDAAQTNVRINSNKYEVFSKLQLRLHFSGSLPIHCLKWVLGKSNRRQAGMPLLIVFTARLFKGELKPRNKVS